MRTLKTLYKRSFALFLAIALCVSTPQFTAFAEGTEAVEDVDTNTPAETPASAEDPVPDQEPAEESAPVADPEPVEDPAPTEESAPATEAAPAEEPAQAEVLAEDNVAAAAAVKLSNVVNEDIDAVGSDADVPADNVDVTPPEVPEIAEDGASVEKFYDDANKLIGWKYTQTDENGVEIRKVASPVYGQDGTISYKVSTTKVVKEDQIPQKPLDAPAVKDENGAEIADSYQYVENGVETVVLPIKDENGTILGYNYTQYDSESGAMLDAYVLTTAENADAIGENKTEVIEGLPKTDESVKVEVTLPDKLPTPPEGYVATAEGSSEYTKTEVVDGVTKTYSWTREDILDEGGRVIGYVIKTTEMTVTTGEVPEVKPEGATDIEGGYEYTTTETLEDGTERTIITRVINGVATVAIVDTVETKESFSATENFQGNGNAGTMLEKPEPPKGYIEVKDNEYSYSEPINNGNTTGTVDYVWKMEEIKDSAGNVIGYVTETVKTEKTETRVPNVPTNKPANAVDIEGGYRYTTTETLADGRTRTTITTVINGETITSQTIVTTTETRQEIKVNEEGSVTVTMSSVVNGNKEPECTYTTLTPDVNGKYDWKGYDAGNNLYDREGFKSAGLGKITASSLNVRKGPGSTYDTYDKKGTTLKNGAAVYIYEVKNGWYRIGENAWISGSHVEPMFGTFQVNTNRGYVYSEPNTNDRVASRGNGSYVRVDEVKTVNGVVWCHINSDGNYSGWIEKDKLNFVGPHDPTMVPENTDKLEHEFPDGYDYVFIGENGLESSIRVDTVGSSASHHQAHQFILRDRKNNKLYVYCADFGTEPQNGYHYKMVDLDEFLQSNTNNMGNSMTPEKLQHIKDIAQNGFWGTTDNGSDSDAAGSLEALKKKLGMYLESLGEDSKDIQGVLDAITPGIALTATQAAIWVYGNTDPNKKINVSDLSQWDEYLGTYFTGFNSTTGKDYTSRKEYEASGNASRGQWEKVFKALSDDEKEALKAVLDWLIQIDKDTPGATTTPETIDETNFATSASVEVVGSQTVGVTQSGDPDVVYDANVSFAMKVTPSRINDDLIVTIYVNGVAQATRRIAGEGKEGTWLDSENGVYTIDGIKLPNGATIDIVLTGTQDLGNGVYIFSSEKNGNTTSQTFIGLSGEHKKQEIALSTRLVFDVTEAKAVVTTTKTQSVDPGTPSTWNTGYSRSEVTESDDDTTPENPGGDDDDDDTIPDEPTPLGDEPGTEIPEEPTPLADTPVLVELVDEEVPLAGAPELVDLFDEDVPLANVPMTGDISVLWYALIFAAAGCLAVLKGADKKKRNNF